MNNTCNYNENFLQQKKILDVTTKPTKLEQTKESPTIQFLSEKFQFDTYLKTRFGRDSNPRFRVQKRPHYLGGQVRTSVRVVML